MDTYIRKAAYISIGKIYKGNADVLPGLLNCLDQLFEELSFRIRQTVVYSCGEIAVFSFIAVKPIIDKGVTDPHHSVRNAVIGALKKAGESNPQEIIAYCKDNITSSDAETRRMMCHGLELRGRTHPEEVIEVHGRYEKFSEFTREYVISYFANGIYISPNFPEKVSNYFWLLFFLCPESNGISCLSKWQ